MTQNDQTNRHTRQYLLTPVLGGMGAAGTAQSKSSVCESAFRDHFQVRPSQEQLTSSRSIIREFMAMEMLYPSRSLDSWMI